MAKYLTVIGLVLCCLGGCSDEVDVDLPISRQKLNDTGIIWGADYPTGDIEDCSTVSVTNTETAQKLDDAQAKKNIILQQQDCMHGRDVAIKDDSNGHAGFVYQKYSNIGKKLSKSAKEWDCVLDEVTGLLWEVKHPSDMVYGNNGLHDSDDRFTWYNPNKQTNGGAIGDWNSRFFQCSGYVANQPETYCNIEEFASRVNKEGLCGYNDWRVPTRLELAGLVNFGHSAPAIDTDFFPNTREEFYWSSSPDASLSITAWAISFQAGHSSILPRNNGQHVRLVSSRTSTSERTD